MKTRPVSDDSRRILRLPEVITLTGLRRATIYQRMSQGTFPAPVKLGERAVGWRAGEVYRWLDELPCCQDEGGA